MSPLTSYFDDSLFGRHQVLNITLADLISAFAEDDEALLLFAARTHTCNHEVVQYLSSRGVNFDARDTHGYGALHWTTVVCHSPRSDTSISIDLLLRAGADIEATDSNGYTALHWAACEGNLRATKRLLAAGAIVNAVSNTNQTPLHEAARRGHLEVVQQLVEGGASIRNVNHNRDTALAVAYQTIYDEARPVVDYLAGQGQATILDLARWSDLAPHKAALHGGLDAVEDFLASGFPVGLPDEEGYQMIHRAVWNDQVGVLKFILGRGTATSCATTIEGYRPIHLAAMEGRAQAISALCDFNANVNVRSGTDGCSALHYAAQGGHDDAISELLYHGADINALDDQDLTALFHAVQWGEADTVLLLCDNGASVNPPGYNADIEAANQEYTETLSTFCETGGNVQVDRGTGTAPLYQAVANGNTEVIQILLKYGADVNVITDDNGWTPLHLAADQNREDIVNLLLEEGADRGAMTDDGYTTWALAEENGEVRNISSKPRRKSPKSARSRASRHQRSAF